MSYIEKLARAFPFTSIRLKYIDHRKVFLVYAEDVEVKDGAVLISEVGEGQSPEEAAMNYIYTIGGKNLVYMAESENNRKEIILVNL